MRSAVQRLSGVNRSTPATSSRTFNHPDVATSHSTVTGRMKVDLITIRRKEETTVGDGRDLRIGTRQRFWFAPGSILLRRNHHLCTLVVNGYRLINNHSAIRA